MHIFSVSTICLQSLKNIHKKLLEELNTQTPYPYNAKYCLKWLSSEGCQSVKINSSSIKNPQAHLQYVHNKSAKFENIGNCGEVDYTNCIPYSAKISLNDWVQKAVIPSELILHPSKTHMPIFIMSTTSMQGFKKTHWKLKEELITQTLYPTMQKNCLKWLSSKVIILSESILMPSKEHMHIFIMSTTGMQGFKKSHWKL